MRPSALDVAYLLQHLHDVLPLAPGQGVEDPPHHGPARQTTRKQNPTQRKQPGELLRKQSGGCAQHTARKPCQIERFEGAKFKYLAASTVRADGSTLFPATGMRSFGKGRGAVQIGFIGLTLKDTSNLVSPDGIKGLTFGDEAAAINAQVPPWSG